MCGSALRASTSIAPGLAAKAALSIGYATVATDTRGEIRPDPGDVQVAIDRYRDLAKYLITIFAGVGALLVAGTQLASIGDLSFEDEPTRVIAVIAGLILALGAIVVVVGLALRVLRPVDMTFDDVFADAELRAQIDGTSFLGGARSLDEVRANLSTTALTETDRDSWFVIADDIVARASFLRARWTFEGIWLPLLGVGIVGVIGIVAFTWGANPPEGSTKSPVVEPVPVEVHISLNAEGRRALAGALGGERCTTRPIAALWVGGTVAEPKVVTLPREFCKSVQLMLPPDWGVTVRSR